MLSDVRLLVAGISILVLAVGPAAAAPPTAGEVVPGASLGGLRLGATKAVVERAWGRAYGICTSCPRETWYFNYFAFEPEGVGVELRGGRAAALFTLHSPAGWRTKQGLELGAGVAEVRGTYGALTRFDCDGYYALVIERARSRTAFYILRERLWAFGLSRPSVGVCR